MRNNHVFKRRVKCRCTELNCGNEFMKTVTVEYVTNQRGDVIEHKIK